MPLDPFRSLVEAHPRLTVSAPAQTAVGAAAGIVLAQNFNRKGFTIVNTGVTVLYIAYGSVDPTTTAYHYALSACTNANDGTGGTFAEDSFGGTVRAIGSAGGGTCVIMEIT